MTKELITILLQVVIVYLNVNGDRLGCKELPKNSSKTSVEYLRELRASMC
jgi:hypothetical protein